MENLNKWKKTGLIGLIIVLPLLIGVGVKIIDNIPLLNKIPGDNGDWIGFWASYLGTIVAILVAVWVAKHESKSNKEEIDHLNKLQEDTVVTLDKINKNQDLMVKELNNLTHVREEISTNEINAQKEFISKKLKIDFFQQYYNAVDDFANKTVQYNSVTRDFKKKLNIAPDKEIKLENLRIVRKRYYEFHYAELEVNRFSRMVEDLFFEEIPYELRIIIKNALENNRNIGHEYYAISGPYTRANVSKGDDSDSVPSKDLTKVKNDITKVDQNKIEMSIRLWDKIQYDLGAIIKKLYI